MKSKYVFGSFPEQMIGRVKGEWRRLHRGSSILVVSHGVFLQQFHGVLRGKNCIESLADWVSNLEMTSFTFSGNRLLEERSIKLVDKKQFDF